MVVEVREKMRRLGQRELNPVVAEAGVEVAEEAAPRFPVPSSAFARRPGVTGVGLVYATWHDDFGTKPGIIEAEFSQGLPSFYLLLLE